MRTVLRASAAPVLAIGGVTRERFAAVASTGAAGVGAIGLFIRHDALADVVARAHRMSVRGVRL